MGEIKIPDSLLPENIMATVDQKIKKEKIKKKRKKVATISALSTAAVIFLIAGVYLRFFNKTFGQQEGNIEGLNKIKSYQSLYNYFKDVKKNIGVSKGDNTLNDMNFGNSIEEGGMEEIDDYGDYSETNKQTEGIDEGDIVKTDGKFIYIIKEDNKAVIFKADGENTKKVSETDIEEIISDKYEDIEEDSIRIIETYIYENKLVVLAEGFSEKIMSYAVSMEMNNGNVQDTQVMRQEGYFYDSRMKDGILYLITGKFMSVADITGVDDVIGMADDKIIKPEDTFYVNIDEYYNEYYIMSSVDIKEDLKVIDSKSYIGEGVQLYVSSDYIYMLDGYMENTNIVRFSMENGNINPTASCVVKGVTDDSFSADEYNGYLRVVTTHYEGNNLYVINEDFKIVGSITGIAKGEQIKSARFMGNTGYFVTYRNTDPLFTVDLSEPENPKLTDELKITGYSAYLHFMDENNLLGIGYESDANTGFETGIKVTLFDVSDKTDVKVKKNLEYEGEEYTSDAIWNHKAVMAADDRGIYGFCLYSYNYAPYIEEYLDEVYVKSEISYQYKVFLYENGDIKEVESIEKAEEDDSMYMVRGLYAGDYFYLVGGENIYVYSLDEIISDDTAEELLSIMY